MNEQDTYLSIKNNPISDTIIEEIFLILNQKEKDIIQKRFAIRTPSRKTLEQIGQDYSITRERVRQIEHAALNKLKRIAEKTSLASVIKITGETIEDQSAVITEKKLLREILKRTNGLFANCENLILLSIAINPYLDKIKKSKIFRKSWYDSKKVGRKTIEKVNALAEEILKAEAKIVPAQTFLGVLQSRVKTNLKQNLSKNTISSILSVSKKLKRVLEGYGLTTWRDVLPKSIKDKSLIILKRTGKPLHYKTIAKLIDEQKFDRKSVTVQAVHNELIRYGEFVLVGRGIYALKEWGFESGTVKDVIAEILRKHGPLNKNKIIEEVLKKRQVKIGTISLNLQKYPEFKRIGRAVYSVGGLDIK